MLDVVEKKSLKNIEAALNLTVIPEDLSDVGNVFLEGKENIWNNLVYVPVLVEKVYF